jgi:hypothetical protein
MALTYTPIATQTLSSTATSVTFSSISGSYTDIILVVSAKTGASGGTQSMGIRFNSDTGSNYSGTEIRGNGTSAISSRYADTYGRVGYLLGATGDQFGINQIHLMNYANTTTNKSYILRGNVQSSGEGIANALVGLWRNTSAITSINVFPDYTGSFAIGSTFSLYGLLAA